MTTSIKEIIQKGQGLLAGLFQTKKLSIFQTQKISHTWFLEVFKSPSHNWEVYGVDLVYDNSRKYYVPCLIIYEVSGQELQGFIGILDGTIYGKLILSSPDLVSLRTWISHNKHSLIRFFEYGNVSPIRELIDESLDKKRKEYPFILNKEPSQYHGNVDAWKKEYIIDEEEG